MSPVLVSALATALVSGVVTSLLVPPILKLAGAIRGLHPPDELREADAPYVPRLGGVAIAAGIFTGSMLGLLADWGKWSGLVPKSELVALPLAAGLVFLVGAIDDLFGVSPFKKFLVQLLAAWLLVRVGWRFEELNLPFVGEIELGFWGGIVSMLWIVGVTNAINLLDGLDGLAGGVAAIISTGLLVFALLQGNPGSVVLLAGICGACLGFLRHNWEPARVFMGDSGALTLGFLLGALSLHSAMKARAAIAILVPILALGLPVIDTLLVMVVRFLGGEGAGVGRRLARMFRADRQHLHHLLGNLVAHRRQVVATLYTTALLFCAGAVVVAVTGDRSLGLLLLGLQVLAVLVMRRLGLARQARALADHRIEALRLGRPSWLGRDSGATRVGPEAPAEPPRTKGASREGAAPD